MGILGQTEDGSRPWQGRDYPEKAFFLFALVAVCSEFELDLPQLMDYYNLDLPKTTLGSIRVSFPLFLDIRTHLKTVAMLGEAPFTVSSKLAAAIDAESGELRELLGGAEE
jgi:hypothetical protein